MKAEDEDGMKGAKWDWEGVQSRSIPQLPKGLGALL